MVTRVWLADFGLENDQPWCSFRVTIKWRPERKCKSFYRSMTRENEPESYCLCFSSQVAVSQLLPHRRQSCPWPQSSNLSTRAPNPQNGRYYSLTKRPCVVSLSSRIIQLVGLLQLANDLVRALSESGQTDFRRAFPRRCSARLLGRPSSSKGLAPTRGKTPAYQGRARMLPRLDGSAFDGTVMGRCSRELVQGAFSSFHEIRRCVNTYSAAPGSSMGIANLCSCMHTRESRPMASLRSNTPPS
jgi:hypothetical protein